VLEARVTLAMARGIRRVLHPDGQRGRGPQIAAVLVASVVAALSGIDVAKCLVLLILAPATIVVGYEGRGYRYEAEALGANAV